MTTAETFNRIKNFHTQAVKLHDALSGITELEQYENGDNHTESLIEWACEKAGKLEEELDEMLMEMSNSATADNQE